MATETIILSKHRQTCREEQDLLLQVVALKRAFVHWTIFVPNSEDERVLSHRQGAWGMWYPGRLHAHMA